MDIRLVTDMEGVSWQALSRLYALAPLGKKRDPQRLETAFRNSTLKVFAYDGAVLVGAGRAWSDGIWRAAIYDVAVLPTYQGNGIGSMMIKHLISVAKAEVIMMYAAEGKSGFYERLGFRKMTTAMAIMPDEEEARRRGLIE